MESNNTNNPYQRLYTIDEAVTKLLDWDRQGKFGTDCASRRTSEDSWAGASWPQSVKLMTQGWPGGVAKLDVKASSKMAKTLRPKQVWDVAGSECDVAAYLSGAPECMGEVVRRKRAAPVCRIGVDRSASAMISRTAIEHLGRSVLTLVESLRLVGCAAEVWSCEGVTKRLSTDVFDIRVRVQEAGRPIDVGRLAYWVAHPAALRRTFFALEETETMKVREKFGFKNGYGYGTPKADYAAEDFDEWAPSPQRGTKAVEAWVTDVLERRLG